MDANDPRCRLRDLAAERGVSLAELSRLIGRNAAYVQQFVRRGSPRRLEEGDRSTLARYFGVSESELGGRFEPTLRSPARVRRLDLAAAAGGGGLGEELPGNGVLAADPAVLAALGVEARQLAIVPVHGDSMVPTLQPGDLLLVDEAQREELAEAIHVLRLDGALLVKRLRPEGRRLIVTSDNPAYPPLSIALSDVSILGRVVGISRRL